MGITLSELFREKVSSSKDVRMKTESVPDIAYPTGFITFDYMNGTVVHVKKDGMKFQYDSVGIIDGSMVYAIGRSGSGKTTLLLQWAGAIIKPYKSSCIYHDDAEGGITDNRKCKLVKMHGEEMAKRYIPRNTGITGENFYERIKIIHDLKMENREAFEYDTERYDESGNKIYKLEPTVYLLDSLAMLTPDKYSEEEELSGQMSSTATAKLNTTIFKRIIPMLKSANIILFIVNHITESVEINAFAKKQGQLSFLKPGERLGGGRAPVYVSNLLIRLDDHSKMTSDKEFGINGSLVDITLLKSRTAAAGSKITLVFDFESGFDADLSLLYFLKQEKLVNGAGAFLYFGDRKDYKFAQKNFKAKLRAEPEFRDIVMETVIPALRELINDSGEISDDYDDFDLSANIMNMINSKQQVA